MQTASELASDLNVHGPDSLQGQDVQSLIWEHGDVTPEMTKAILERNGYSGIYFFDKTSECIRDAMLNGGFEIAFETVICEGKDHIFLILEGQQGNPTIQ